MLQQLILQLSGIFRKKDATCVLLKQLLGFRPTHWEYYQLALTHRSSMRSDKQGHLINNERLEFLGDSVLGTIVADLLYRQFPNKDEGDLTNLRSRLVKRETLDRLALNLHLDRLVKSAQRYHGGRGPKVHINGNAFEALMGAIYLDKGYDGAYKFVERLFQRGLLNMHEAEQEKNFKSSLIEWAQQHKCAYEFRLVHSEVNKHDNTTTFTSEVYLNNICCGTGSGSNKKTSEQQAARSAWAYMKEHGEASLLPPTE